MIDYLIDLDTDIFLYLNDMHSSFWDKFMWLFSGKFIWIPMYLMFLIVFFKDFSWRRSTVLILGIALAVTLADQLCGNFLRYYFTRLRPANPDNPISMLVHIVEGYRGGAYGFPSCHAANSFALAAFSSLLFRKKRFTIFIMLWAVLNSYSRIYLGVHYPGDLLVGGIIGALSGTLWYYIARTVITRVLDGTQGVMPDIPLRTIRVNEFDIRYRDCDYMMMTGIIIVAVIILLALG